MSLCYYTIVNQLHPKMVKDALFITIRTMCPARSQFLNSGQYRLAAVIIIEMHQLTICLVAILLQSFVIHWAKHG